MDTESFRAFEKVVAQTGYTYVFDEATSLGGVEVLIDVVRDMGLDPMLTGDLKKGLFTLFNVELINLPDLKGNRYILTPNHVSDIDALLLGLLHPAMRVVAKSEWISNQKLLAFLAIHYDLHGLDRASIESLRRLLTDAVAYFADEANKHYLVFSQGTISDFNRNSVARISPVAQTISVRTGVPVVNVFMEQVSLDHPTRIVFDAPMLLTRRDDFSQMWLDRQAAMQNALLPPARSPVLSHKHANNNKPGDRYF